MTITAERLRDLLRYEPDSGRFFYLKRPSNNKHHIGDIATGHLRGGYRRLGINGTDYSLHRLAFLYMLGRDPIGEVDHINRTRSDNRWRNLREVTRTENMHN